MTTWESLDPEEQRRWLELAEAKQRYAGDLERR